MESDKEQRAEWAKHAAEILYGADDAPFIDWAAGVIQQTYEAAQSPLLERIRQLELHVKIEHGQCDSEHDRAIAAESRVAELEQGMRSLCNEVSGAIGAVEEEDLADVIGWTNSACIKRRLEEAKGLLLAPIPPSTEPKEKGLSCTVCGQSACTKHKPKPTEPNK